MGFCLKMCIGCRPETRLFLLCSDPTSTAILIGGHWAQSFIHPRWPAHSAALVRVTNDPATVTRTTTARRPLLHS